jgi:hypothetical protein
LTVTHLFQLYRVKPTAPLVRYVFRFRFYYFLQLTLVTNTYPFFPGLSDKRREQHRSPNSTMRCTVVFISNASITLHRDRWFITDDCQISSGENPRKLCYTDNDDLCIFTWKARRTRTADLFVHQERSTWTYTDG